MTTSRLLRERMKQKGYSKTRLQNEVGCCEKTLRQYLNGTTTSGPYLTRNRGRKIFCVYGKNSSLIRNRYV